jgi:radical SAM family uncharacterized protein/radical SAM-linked protein
MSKPNLLHHVSRPGRYLGGEYNTPLLSESALVSCLFAFPDLYEIGMSHQGLQILYHIVNALDDTRAERCYCPAPDAEQWLRDHQVVLGSLESGQALKDFDLLGITLPHELCYTNILTMLDLAQIPFLAAERAENQPIVLGGGTCAFNPEPVADFFDAICVGDGEEAIIDICAVLKEMKQRGASKQEIIAELGRIDGVYLPHLYRPRYHSDGRLSAIEHDADTSSKLRRRILPDLDRLDHLKHPLVPGARIVHDRLALEVARGCTRGCRFCQAGITYRPVRERSTAQIMELAEQGIARSGFEELALLSLSTGDYSCLPEVLPKLMKRFAGERVSVAMPSMRVGTLNRELMDAIRRVRKTGFTLAPEAGSERLRQSINKGITEEALLQAAADAYALGWNLIKLYFMIGLPTETDEDLEAITALVEKTAQAGQIDGRGRKRISVSVGTFVPKPHTPFQWEPQLSIKESRRRLQVLKSALHKRSTTLKYHDPEQSFLEGVFARGDRRLAKLTVSAWQRGARLDSWSDYFNLLRWREAAEDCALDLDFYLRRRETDELLPWSHIDSGVEIAYLLEERDKSLSQIYTEDCRYHGCQKCGLCDFKTVMPIVHNKKRLSDEPPAGATEDIKAETSSARFRYLISYGRSGPICYLGHLEFLQIIFRSLRRAGFKTHFSQGYNPSPKVSFGPALPVGTMSRSEFFSVDLVEPLSDFEQAKARLNQALPEGLAVVEIKAHQGRLPQNLLSRYLVSLPFTLSSSELEQIESFIASSTFLIEKTRKGKTKKIDVRPLVQRISATSSKTVELDLISRSGAPGTKPFEILAALLDRELSVLLDMEVLKISWSELDD